MNTSFDPATHEYRLDGKQVFSVTQILKKVGVIDDSWFKPEHAQRGTFVHEACELYDRGNLEYEALDSQIKGYVDAWIKFRELMPVKFDVIEGVYWNTEYGFVGRMDRAWTNGRDTTVCDIKTGAFPDWLSMQLGAYSILYPATFACGVRLGANGKFSMKNIAPYELSLGRKKFLVALEKVKHA